MRFTPLPSPKWGVSLDRAGFYDNCNLSCAAVQHSTAQHSTVEYSAVQCSSVQYITLHHSAVPLCRKVSTSATQHVCPLQLTVCYIVFPLLSLNLLVYLQR